MPSNPAVIRRATRQDVDSLLRLLDAVAQEGIYIGTEPGYDRRRMRENFTRMLLTPEERPVFVACAGPEMVGELSIFQHDEFGPTISMMVAKAWRGRGIGGALLNRAIAWARERRLPALSLLVFPHNHRAVALYRKAGFAEVERYERDVVRRSGEVWDSMLMRKPIMG